MGGGVEADDVVAGEAVDDDSFDLGDGGCAADAGDGEAGAFETKNDRVGVIGAVDGEGAAFEGGGHTGQKKARFE